jgi:hypothetical protein
MSQYGDDDYGFDPKREHRARMRNLLDGIEQRVQNGPGGLRQIAERLNIRPPTRTEKRLLEAHAEILDQPQPDGRSYLHTVLCQTGLPYKDTELRKWEREQGRVRLMIEAGHALDPHTGKFMELGLPYGEKPRLILIYLSTKAVLDQSPVIDVGDSMTAFIRSLGVDTNGRSIKHFKDQLARLCAATIRLGTVEDGRAKQINTPFVGGFDLWFPKDPNQRVLWPSTVRLSADYFDSLRQHAVPLDPRALTALAGSAMALDVYCWLAQRLHRIEPGQDQFVSWPALQAQFGPDYTRSRRFREAFNAIIKRVKAVYPDAKIIKEDKGYRLYPSKPPIAKTVFMLGKGTVIDAKPLFSDNASKP